MYHEQRTVSLKRLNSFYFSMGFYFQWDYKQDPRETLQTHRTPRWSIGLLLPTYQGHVCFASLSIAASCFVVVVVVFNNISYSYPPTAFCSVHIKCFLLYSHTGTFLLQGAICCMFIFFGITSLL